MSLVLRQRLSSSLLLSRQLLSTVSTSQPLLDTDDDELNHNTISNAELKLINQLHSLIKSHRSPLPNISSPPHDLITVSLSESFSALSPSPLSPSAAATLLRRLRSPRLSLPFPQSLSFFNWWINSLPSPCSDSSLVYAEIIDFAGKLQNFDIAWKLLDQMRERKVPINFRVFSILVRRLARAGLTSEAAHAFRRMPEYGLHPDNTSLSAVISVFSRKRAAAEAQALFDSLRGQFDPDVVVYSALIHSWCRAGRIDEAERVFREMKEAGVIPNVYTYTTVIDAMCKAGQLPRAHELLCQMLDSGCPPNTATFNAFMRAHVKAGRTEQVLQVNNQMKQLGCEPDIITYNFIIDAHCRKGQQNLDAALKMLNQMGAKQCSPDAHSFNPIFKCILNLNDMNAAHKLYERMRELKVQPNIVTYNLLMELFSNAKSMDMVLKMKREMEEEGVEPNVNTYGVLITAFCGRGHWKRAYWLMKEMVGDKGLKPSNSIYEKVMMLLRNAGQLKKHDELEEKMMDMGFVERPL